MSDEWNPFRSATGRVEGRNRFRMVEKNDDSDFGEVWYNPESDSFIIRRVSHEVEDGIWQMLEGRLFSKYCDYIGDL